MYLLINFNTIKFINFKIIKIELIWIHVHFKLILMPCDRLILLEGNTFRILIWDIAPLHCCGQGLILNIDSTLESLRSFLKGKNIKKKKKEFPSWLSGSEPDQYP